LHPVTVRLTDGERIIGRSVVRLDVSKPISILSAVPAFEQNGARRIDVLIANETKDTVAGTLAAKFKGKSVSSTPYKLKPGERATVGMPVTDAIARDSAVLWPFRIVSTTQPQGVQVAETKWLSFIPCKRMDNMKLDGDLSRFKGVSPVELSDPAQVLPRDYWNGTEDLSGKVYLAWDDKYLYLGVDVQDDTFLQENQGVLTWAHDCIQFAVDPTPGKPQEYDQMTMQYSKKNTEFILALTGDKTSVYRSVSWDKNRPAGDVKPGDVELVVKKTKTGAVYEAAFTWESLFISKPKAGQVIGLALTINDKDRKDGPFKGFQWFGGILNSKDPGIFGQVVLSR
jgi:hypothetical protein